MESNWRKTWNDPVWSKVISAIIILVSGTFFVIVVPNWEQMLKNLFQYEIKISVWMIILALIASAAIKYLFSRRSGSLALDNLTSKQWFSEIDEQIKDCNFARIYLRNFDHPDQFKPEHRDSLQSFMKSLAERLESGADIKVIAYHTSLSEKSGLDWLCSELKTNKDALSNIKLIKNQPTSNTSSMYLFDSGAVLFNRRLKSGHSYHVENLQGSIVHYLIERGFNASQDKLQ